jgi:hypothetical protein
MTSAGQGDSHLVSIRKDRTASTLERRLEKFEGLNRGDGSPTNHCNGRFRVGGKSKRVIRTDASGSSTTNLLRHLRCG